MVFGTAYKISFKRRADIEKDHCYVTQKLYSDPPKY